MNYITLLLLVIIILLWEEFLFLYHYVGNNVNIMMEISIITISNVHFLLLLHASKTTSVECNRACRSNRSHCHYCSRIQRKQVDEPTHTDNSEVASLLPTTREEMWKEEREVRVCVRVVWGVGRGLFSSLDMRGPTRSGTVGLFTSLGSEVECKHQHHHYHHSQHTEGSDQAFLPQRHAHCGGRETHTTTEGQQQAGEIMMGTVH